MAHYNSPTLPRPTAFNFATDVVDHWATQHPQPEAAALHWLSSDRGTERKLSFAHFSRRSHRIAVLLRSRLGVARGEKMLVILPRVPEW